MKTSVSAENPAKLKNLELSKTLDRLGIEKTWKSVIVTHISKNNTAFTSSISESDEFKDAEILDQDFLEGLTLGETSILYEFSLAHVDRTSRKKEGQYFTPDDVAVFLAEKSIEFPKGVWLDPCSGIGNLSHWLAARQENPEQFVIHNLHLLDMDPLALLIARALFAIHFQDKETDLFGIIKNNFTVRNLLDDGPLPVHDFAIMNPPYVATLADDRFDSVKARDLYAYCVERIAKTSKGFISITPQSFTNSTKFSGFRKMLMDKFTAFDVYCFDNVPDTMFKGIKFGSHNSNTANSTRASVMVVNPSSNTKYRITPLLRWKTSERATMLDKAPEFLTNFTPTSEIFPKINKDLGDLYAEMMNPANGHLPLNSFLSSTPTEFSLIVPSTPRYFIPAVRRELNRTSFKQLFFKNQDDADKMYLLLNSSLMYWWWRVNDGGMTLSSSTLFTLPVPPSLTNNAKLVERLEQSEQDNLVVKMNAGKPNENVKHGFDLIKDVNQHIVAKYADALVDTHKNSHL